MPTIPQALSELSQALPGTSLGEALLFCAVAEHEGQTLTEYARNTKLPLNKVSRYAGKLMDVHMIVLKPSPKSRREKLVYLAASGSRLARHIIDHKD